MAGYWLGPVTPEEAKSKFFFEERMIGYPAFQKRIMELDEFNFENDQILILFLGETKNTEEEEEDGGSSFQPTKVWDPECQMLEDVIDLVKVRARPNGWLLHVGVGSLDEWKDPNNPFKRDPRIRVSKLPTLLAWNTMKKVSGRQALKIPNIVVMLDD